MKLRDLRVEAGLSQEELGRLLAIEEGNTDSIVAFQPRISSYETGRSQVSLSTARLIVRILNDRLSVVGSEMRASVDTLEFGE